MGAKSAATEDPATARRGESLYAFYPKEQDWGRAAGCQPPSPPNKSVYSPSSVIPNSLSSLGANPTSTSVPK